MSESIEELRAQRKLIQQHLDWLNAQIRQAENNSNGYQPDESAKTATSVSTDSRNRKITKTTAPVSDASIYSSIEAGFMQPSSASDMRRVRIGCFFIFAVVILIFLFVLFGLPYLLY